MINRRKLCPGMPSTFLCEDRVKQRLQKWLKADGWKITEIKWGKSRGADIVASKQSKKWVIEVKGEGSRTQMRLNYFLTILGEIMQRMSRAHTKYSIALPDLERYRKLWQRLPSLVKRRTKLTIIFIPKRGQPEEIRY